MSWMFYTGESGTLEGCYGEVIEAISKQAFYSTMRFICLEPSEGSRVPSYLGQSFCGAGELLRKLEEYDRGRPMELPWLGHPYG